MKTNICLFNKLLVAIFIGIACPVFLYAQRITYTEPEREDNRRTNFEIIGKIGGNFLIFKNNRTENDISVYNQDFKLLNRVKQTDMDDRWINVDFVAYPEFAWMVYQYQRRNIIYCKAVKIGPDGKRISEPIELDTARIGYSASTKIYTTINSDDRQKIMVFKINSRNPKNFVFTTLLYNPSLELQQRHELSLPMEERNDYFTDFLLDNDGDLVFGKYFRRNGSEYITNVQLLIKKADQPQFIRKSMQSSERVLDEIKIKVDNTNKRYLFNAFFYKEKRGNIEGLYSVVWDKAGDSVIRQTEFHFADDLRKLAKGPDANLKMAFNDYFLSSIITRKDGGYILVAESLYTSSRGNNFNRWNYMNWNNPWLNPIDYYYWSPYSIYSPWNSPFYRYGGSQATRYHAENIMMLSIDKNGGIEWSNIIPKSQFDDDGDALISHFLMITGGELHFLFNQYERRTLLLNDQGVNPDGNVIRYPTLKNLDRETEFMPRYGKQISSSSVIIPCFYRNYLTFAKIDF